jgi:hypothetical protein
MSQMQHDELFLRQAVERYIVASAAEADAKDARDKASAAHATSRASLDSASIALREAASTGWEKGCARHMETGGHVVIVDMVSGDISIGKLEHV